MNKKHPIDKYPTRAVAYYVENVEVTARQHSKVFGSGPFFSPPEVSGTIRLGGRDLHLNQSTAFGQSGSQMVELVQQNPGSDPLVRELFPWPPNDMIHHLSIFVDDLDRERARMCRAGR